MKSDNRIEWLHSEEQKIDSLNLDEQLDQLEFKKLVKGYLKLTVSLLDFLDSHGVIDEQSPEFLLTQGNYRGGVDIPCGRYDLEAIATNKESSGQATIQAKKPNDEYIFLNVNSESEKATKTFINFEVTEKSYVKVSLYGCKVLFSRHVEMGRLLKE